MMKSTTISCLSIVKKMYVCLYPDHPINDKKKEETHRARSQVLYETIDGSISLPSWA